MNLNLFLQYFKEIKENPTKLKKQLLFRLDFFEIDGAPHTMLNDYIKDIHHFSRSDYVSIEVFLDVFGWYMETKGVEDEDIFMRALGASLD